MRRRYDVRKGRKLVPEADILGSPVAVAITKRERDFIEAQARELGVTKSFLTRQILLQATEHFTTIAEGVFNSRKIRDHTSEIVREKN